jgi:TfoX/Sxy family transcriptional regulator of competence genes
MKPTPQAIARFERTFPPDPRAEPKKMFGHPAAFVGGHMFFGTFEDQLVFRIAGADAKPALEAGAVQFAPMQGREWKDYVSIGSGTAVPDATLMSWAQTALERAADLPAKVKKPKAKAKKA